MFDNPGIEELKRKGYIVYSREGSLYRNITLVKNGVFITVYDDNSAVMSFTHNVLMISTGRFQFPHPHFEQVYENPIIEAYKKMHSGECHGV